MSGNVDNRIHFGIPIFEYRLPDFADHQQSLVSHLMSLQEQDSGVTRSNQGGWHSDDQLHIDKHSDIQWLMQQLYAVGSQCIRHHENSDNVIEDIHMVNCWVNINKKGDWNAPHHHAPQDWSGVVYINDDQPPPQKRQAIQDGDIVFFDPVGPSWVKHRAATISHPAEEGKVLIFPSYVLHMVAPYSGNKPRISIAFNFKLQYND